MSSVTPFFSIDVSSSLTVSSNVKPYWKPEHPPPVTNTRSLRSALPSSSMRDFTLVAAASVKISGAGISVMAFIAYSLNSALALSAPGPGRSIQRSLHSLADGAFELYNRCGLGFRVRQLSLHDRAYMHFQDAVHHISIDPCLGLQFQIVVGDH